MSAAVGVIGLGAMGAALAMRLADAGWDVLATSRSERTREEARARGIRVCTDIPELTAALAPHAIVVTSLPAGPEVRAACLGPGGVLDSAPDARPVIVDTSTCAPGDSRSLAAELGERGCLVVDAPVSGGPEAAREGTLSVMAGGDADDLAAADEVLRAFAGRLVVCGGPGAGQIAKACNQLVVASSLAVVAEALVTASALGVDPAAVREALLGGYAGSRVLELHGERMLRRDFSPGGSARNQLKDIEIIRELTDGITDNRVFDAAAEAMAELVAEGGADLDHSAVVRVIEQRTGHSL